MTQTKAPKNRPNLVQALTSDLAHAITSGAIPVGGKLPTEATLTEKHSVSRTVVREAIAALRADGLVEARQGSGVFVTAAQPATISPFQALHPQKLSSIIELLEFRVAVEVEAAALAAARRSPAQQEAIFEALEQLDRAQAEGRSTAEADLAFHAAITTASNNPRFGQFLAMLGKDAIPRSRLSDVALEQADPDYQNKLRAEHRRIADAIDARDEGRARDAMRLHLFFSQERYRQMLRAAQ